MPDPDDLISPGADVQPQPNDVSIESGLRVQPKGPRPELEEVQSSPRPKRKVHLPVTVEDVPDEDGVLLSRPSPRADAADTPAATEVLSPVPENQPDVREPRENHRPGVQDSPLHPHIQLQQPLPQEQSPPGVLQYLDADSPAITPEAIQRTVDNSSSGSTSILPHPISPSDPVFSHLSVPSSLASDVFSQGPRTSEWHHSWSPQHVASPRKGHISPFAPQPRHGVPLRARLHEPQGIPPQGIPPQGVPPPGFSHGSPPWHNSPGTTYISLDATPYSSHAVPVTAQPPPPLHPQKPPLTGYQHLALKLTGALPSFPIVTPVYRRFEALNHRLLLQLQDEIAELEKQLDGIDAADTNARAMSMGFLPASRRVESMAQGELGWQKQEILGKIGWKLGQYNKIISSFRETQCLPTPSLQEIDDYRGFLVGGGVIAEPETRFLDDPNDLVSLAAIDWEAHREAQPAGPQAGESTPTPQSPTVFGCPPVNKLVDESSKVAQPRPAAPSTNPRSPIHLAYAAMVSILVPILTFLVIPGILERMTIVVLVFSGVATAVVQSGLLGGLADRGLLVDCFICAGLYGVLMTVVATTFARGQLFGFDCR